jgi:hypothetical protein
LQSVYSGYLVLVELFNNIWFQTLRFDLAAGQWRKRRQREYEVEIIVRRYAVEAFQSAIQAMMDEDILAVMALETADSLHAPSTGASAISRSLVIDMP